MARVRSTEENHDHIAHTGERTSQKKPKWTTLIIVDSQATKNTCNASIESKGFCSYKATNGIKKNLGVDSLGLPFFTLCTKASLSDDKALIEMFAQNIDYFKSKPVNIPKITVMVDHGYHPDQLIPALEQIYPQIMTKIRFKKLFKNYMTHKISFKSLAI